LVGFGFQAGNKYSLFAFSLGDFVMKPYREWRGKRGQAQLELVFDRRGVFDLGSQSYLPGLQVLLKEPAVIQAVSGLDEADGLLNIEFTSSGSHEAASRDNPESYDEDRELVSMVLMVRGELGDVQVEVGREVGEVVFDGLRDFINAVELDTSEEEPDLEDEREVGSVNLEARDYSGDVSNPTGKLQSEFQALMSIDDPDVLKQRMFDVISRSKISPLNLKKAKLTLSRLSDLMEIRTYLCNYILAGSGMSTSQFECTWSREESIGSLLGEDVRVPSDLRRFVGQMEGFGLFLKVVK